MSRKITPEEYVQWLKDDGRGIVALEEYINAHTPIDHQCPEGHLWKASPTHIKKGSGCPHCSQKYSPTPEEYAAWLRENRPDLSILESYQRATVAIYHQCQEGHPPWRVKPTHIKAGHTCPHCTGRIAEDYREWLAKDGRGIRALESYRGAEKKILHECPKGHRWSQKPAHLKNGIGCPACAEHGFNPSKPAILYVAEHDIGGVMLVNVGITNRAFEERYTGGDLKTVIRHEEFSGDGRFIASLEGLVVEALAPNLASGALGLRMKKGTKECFDIPYETALAEVRRLISEAA